MSDPGQAKRYSIWSLLVVFAIGLGVGYSVGMQPAEGGDHGKALQPIRPGATQPAEGPQAAAPKTPSGGTATVAEPEEITVYVTRTGHKYHRAGCRYLSKSMIPIGLADARRQYSPCSVCQPPE